MVAIGIFLFSVLAMLGSTLAAPALVERAETHTVEIINRCGAGVPAFHDQTGVERRGDAKRYFGTFPTAVMGGVAYLADYPGCPKERGASCGTVEFTLVNPAPGVANPMQNAINYSLLNGVDRNTGVSLGPHEYKYPMNFEYTGAVCAGRKAPGQCLGQSAALCPEAFLGDETEGGKMVMCLGSNAGFRITFC